jgi:copper chaperone CopZ
MMAITTTAMAQIKSATLTASGLTCSMCSKSIYKALLKVPTIKDVQVDIQKSSYDIQFKEGSKVVIDDIKKAVEDAGFSVASMQVKASFNNTEVYNDAHVVWGGNNFHFLGVHKQTLNGEKMLTIVDKNYLPAKDFKKYSKQTKMKCVETGMMGECCTKSGQSGRIYHVTF